MKIFNGIVAVVGVLVMIAVLWGKIAVFKPTATSMKAILSSKKVTSMCSPR